MGGTAPFVDQVLVQTTDEAMAQALHVTEVALLAFATVWSWPESAFGDLDRTAQISVDEPSGESSGASDS